jgi:small subunit ribosomal protein S4e
MKHLKRKPAPKFWPIHRKELVWTVKPRPGSHPISRCIPLLFIAREILDLAKTRKEAKTIISQGKINVDGKSQRDDRFPVGLMDVVSIPDIKKTYRVIPSGKGLFLHQIGKEGAEFKLCRIENKSTLKDGHTQLNLHDGRNILIREGPKEDIYRTLDTLQINLSSKEIVEHMKPVEGVAAIIIGGKNIGKHGKIIAIEEKSGQKRRNSLTTIEDINGKNLQTILNFIFVIGEVQPAISLPEVSY